MSPEHTEIDSGPQSKEVYPLPKEQLAIFDGLATELLSADNKFITELPASEQGVAILKEFTKSLVAIGDVSGSQETYTPEDIIDLIDSISKPEDLQRIPRKDGIRKAVHDLLGDDRVSRLMMESTGIKERFLSDILHPKKEEISVIDGVNSVSNPNVKAGTTALSAEREAVIVNSTMEAMRLAESARPDEQVNLLDRLTAEAGLSADEVTNLRLYAEAVESKKDAQKNQLGEDSSYWGQIAGQRMLKMSDSAKKIASEYTYIHSKQSLN
ncbi:MAG TPA: hypothetical protein PKC86_02620 [Candidatus Saccharibacteria bacterium]|nr:hypothetical protein [Candidatus Saccharibacteria bacterium]